MKAGAWMAAGAGLAAVLAVGLLAIGCSDGMSCHGKSEAPACHSAASNQDPAPVQSPSVGNTRCPIMGGKVDPARVPASLTRQHRDRTVGFCCAGCPAQWDKLSEAEKDAKVSN